MGKAVYMTEITALSEALYQHLTGQMGRVKGGIQETEAIVPVPRTSICTVVVSHLFV